eukprot:XP_010664697.1 PREDICTED: developmental and secondary metabolism regulator veA-like [Vitis vinifera]
MARTRGAKSSSPSGRKRVPREAPVQGPTSEPPRPEAASPQVKPTPQNPPARRYLTRSGGRPLQKRARVESSKPINLTEQSLVPSPEPSPAPSPAPAPMSPAQPQEHQPPLSKPQIPSGVAPEVLIRHPMLTQPPIEGNLDCRARQFHSELCFDTTTFQLRPELADSFRLMRRYHMEHLLAPRDFFYPRVAMDFYQSMTTKQILQHLGYPSDPQLERKHICRDVFTLDKWNNMTAYRVEQPGRPQPVEIPVARRASPRHIHEGIPIASPTISRAPPVTPASSEPSTSAEPRMAIPISEYKELCRSL